MNESTSIYLFWVSIKVTDFRQNKVVDFVLWDNLPFNIRTKYDWYFNYRSALLQIKYPKLQVVKHWGKTEIKKDLKRDAIVKSINAMKSKISKNKKLLATGIKNWSEIFPIEDDLIYKKVIIKMQADINKLKSYEADLLFYL